MKEKATEFLPFLILFLFCFFKQDFLIDYKFGADDSCYYAYLPSLLIDHDLEFQNQFKLSAAPAGLFQRKTPTGATTNEFPIGSAILWAPFFLLGHFLSPGSGYSAIEINSVLFGNLLYPFLGLYFCYRWICEHYSKLLAGACTVGVWLCTPLYFYSMHPILISEGLSFFCVSLLLFISSRWAGKNSIQSALLAGCFAALAVLVRLQNLTFVLIPVFVLFQHGMKYRFSSVKSRNEPIIPEAPQKSVLRFQFLLAAAFFIAALVIVFLPQFIVWKGLYGKWFFPAGELLLWWQKPFAIEVLSSARKGLFPWNPILIVSIAGLFMFWRNSKAEGWLLLAVFLLNFYIVSSQVDWWASTSFGMRRLINCTPIFVLGFAAVLFFFARFQRPAILVLILAFVFGFFGHLNIYLARLFWRGRLPYEHAVQFREILSSFSPYRPIIYAAQFPIELKYAFLYETKLYGPFNELFIGEDIFYFQDSVGKLAGSRDLPVFGSGWETGNGVQIAKPPVAYLYVPLHTREQPNVFMELVARSEEKRQRKADRIEIRMNGSQLRTLKMRTESKQFTTRLFRYKRRVNVLELRTQSAVVVEHLEFYFGERRVTEPANAASAAHE